MLAIKIDSTDSNYHSSAELLITTSFTPFAHRTDYFAMAAGYNFLASNHSDEIVSAADKTKLRIKFEKALCEDPEFKRLSPKKFGLAARQILIGIADHYEFSLEPDYLGQKAENETPAVTSELPAEK